jgi:hypothetical protein
LDQIKKVRRPKQPDRRKLRDQAGNLVDSEKWADTMAQHLQDVQWKVRTADLIDLPPLYPPLQVNMGAISEEEVVDAVRKLRKTELVAQTTYQRSTGKQLSTKIRVCNG